MFLKTSRTRAIILIALATLCACKHAPYVAKPVDAHTVSAKILAKDPLSAEFQAFCKAQGYAGRLPFSAWGVDELTLSAQYFHTKLDIAKAQLGLAQATAESAGIKPTPTLGGTVARTNQANKDIRPFAYGLNVEIPITTANKRTIRTEEAQHLVEAARLDVAETAWNLRSQLRADLLQYHQQRIQIQQIQQTIERQHKLSQLLKKRLDLGLVASGEVAQANLQVFKAQSQLAQLASDNKRQLATLAADAGLSEEKFLQIPLAPFDMDAAQREVQALFADPAKTSSLQSEALLNRLDVRRGLAKYAAAESKIKLEVAKQTPDITLTPGFIFEFGDQVWSLGFANLLNLLNTQPTLIKEAEQLRAVEGAQFEATQAQVIADMAQARAALAGAQSQLGRAAKSSAQQRDLLARAQKQFSAGLLDQYEITLAEIEYATHADETQAAQFALLRAAKHVEDVMQRSLSAPPVKE